MPPLPDLWKQRAQQAQTLQHEFPFDPTCGYTLDDLLQVPHIKPPADFAEFWQSTYRETVSVDPEANAREIAFPHDGWRCEEIDFTSWGGFRVGGWLVTPTEGEIGGGIVMAHGYGGRAEPIPGPVPGMATLYPNARGFNRSARPDLPSYFTEHVVHGIASRDSYILRGCVADLWAATTVLAERFPQLPLFYYGGSFGGGLGSLALPWEPRFTRAFLGYPTFGNHPLRVTLLCKGSGAALRQRYLQDPSILEVLRYYDASSAASLIQTPTFIDLGCFDPSVPPPGQFAIHHGLVASGGNHSVTVHTCHHFTADCSAAEVAQTLRETADWFYEGAGVSQRISR